MPLYLVHPQIHSDDMYYLSLEREPRAYEIIELARRHYLIHSRPDLLLCGTIADGNLTLVTPDLRTVLTLERVAPFNTFPSSAATLLQLTRAPNNYMDFYRIYSYPHTDLAIPEPTSFFVRIPYEPLHHTRIEQIAVELSLCPQVTNNYIIVGTLENELILVNPDTNERICRFEYIGNPPREIIDRAPYEPIFIPFTDTPIEESAPSEPVDTNPIAYEPPLNWWPKQNEKHVQRTMIIRSRIEQSLATGNYQHAALWLWEHTELWMLFNVSNDTSLIKDQVFYWLNRVIEESTARRLANYFVELRTTGAID